MTRLILHLGVPAALLCFALSHLPDAFAAVPGSKRPVAGAKLKTAKAKFGKKTKFKTAAKNSSESSTDELDEEEGEFDEEDLPEDTVEGSLESEEPIDDVGTEISDESEEEKKETESMTKEIVEEPENPEPEFPYPGASEEGFESGTRVVRLESQDTPSGLIQPIRITSTGEYFYGFESSVRNSAASIRMGFFGPPDIVNPENGIFFEQIYGDAVVPTLFGDFQKSLTKNFGDLGLKFGTGLFVSQGEGEFAIQSADRVGREPDEKFSFIMFPNTLTAIYRFQYHETQPIVPYIEGGGGFFTFMEMRDDNAIPKIGGAGVLVAAGGLNFLLDWLDPHSVRELDVEWGINHVWLLTEYRLIQGLNKKYDFSSSVLNAGIMMEF